MDRIQIAAIVGALALFFVSMAIGRGADSARAPEPPAAAAEPEAEAGRPVEAAPSTAQEQGRTAAAEVAGQAPRRAEVERPKTVSELDNGWVRLRVSNEGGRVESLLLERYTDRVGPGAEPVQLVTVPERGVLLASFGDDPLLRGAENARFEVVSETDREVVQRLERDGVELVRSLSLDPEGYGGRLRLRVVNRSSAPIQPKFEVSIPAEEIGVSQPGHFMNYQLAAYVDGDLEKTPLARMEVPGFFSAAAPVSYRYPAGVEWVAAESQYFLLSVSADNPRDYEADVSSTGVRAGQVTLGYPATRPTPSIPPGQQLEKVYRVFMGPKLDEYANAVDPRLSATLTVGWAWVRPLVHLFAGSLKWTYEHVVANYGIAIILLTVLLRMLVFPLTQRSMKSMKRFSLVAPQMKEIQEKYRNDSERLQQEMLALYKRTGVNPFTAMAGGCLPMLLQMPFMIALYYALQGSIDLRHAPFIWWIDDLSAPENFLTLLGFPIRPLPLLMGASMILQQYMTPSTGDPQQGQQKQMMMLMSGAFVFMFYQFPSGLVLYWFVSNLLGIAQQLVVNRQTVTA